MKAYLTLPLASCIFLLIICSCKKNDTYPDCHIIKISQPSGQNYVLSHDAAGRLQSVAYGSSSVTNFTYNSNAVVALSTGISGYYNKTSYTVNANGLVTNSKTEYDAAGTAWQTRNYEYNGTQVVSRTLTGSTGYSGSQTNFIWAGGNLITENITGGNFTQKIEYEYYTDKPYQQGDVQYWDLAVNGIEIVRPKNLLKKRTSTYTDEYSVQYIEISNYSYTFDGDKKIISMTEADAQGSAIFTYDYQCN